MQTLTASPLARTVSETPTDLWNDSCAVDELEYAVAFGAVGATANPTIVVDNWRKDPSRWASRVRELAREEPAWSERELAWGIVAEMSVRAAPLLLPAFEASGGRAGRLSVQTDPTLFRDAPAMVTQAFGFTGLAPNIIVKFPTTIAGLAAMEEASYRGISVNATVSFSVSQALAAARAVQRGIERREADGEDTSRMGPVITIMMGRLEDWLREVVDRDGLTVHPSALPWSGVAVFKRAYAEWQQHGFRARLLGAAIRHHLHWSELIGGDVVITMPSSWQKRFNASSVEVRARIGDPVDEAYLAELRTLPDFVRAFEPDGLSVEDVDSWGPTVKTLRAFIGSYHELLHLVGEALLGVTDLRLAPGEPVTPERAGWRHLSFAVQVLSSSVTVGGHGGETAIVILGGGGARVGDIGLPGRASVWDGLPSAAYLPPGVSATIEPSGQFVTVAVANAPASGRATAEAPVRIGPDDVRVEIRGAGNATRQINHIITPDFPADRLEVVEVYTPSGNWSSWPPHKHDTDDMPNEAVLEEVYSYAFRRPEGWGIQRLYRADGSRDLLWTVRDGETVMVTDGYHPFVATHGDDAYYLNALAGDVRTMACSFDPALDHVRAAWSSMEPDPRVPLVR